MPNIDEKAQSFVRQMIQEWQPNPVMHVLTAKADGLTSEFLSKKELASICTWLNKPADEILIGAVEGIIYVECPDLAPFADIITKALIDACAECHMVNKTVANDNIKTGALITGTALFIIGVLIASYKKK